MSEAPAAGAAPAGLMATRRWSLIASVALTAAVPVVLLAGPAAYRLKLLDLDTAMWGLAQVAMWLALGAVIASFACIAVSVMRHPKRGAIIGVVTLTFACLAGARLWLQLGERDSLPPVWDVQTDWVRPVEFSSETRAAREAAGAVDGDRTIGPEGGRWAGRTASQVQIEYYAAPEGPDPSPEPGKVSTPKYRGIEALRVLTPVPEARAAVEQAMKDLGWSVTRGATAGDVIEGRNVSAWYGLVSDVAVRVEPDGAGSRIDIRSASRTPAPDQGANASRVKDMVDSLALALRPPGGAPTPGPLQ
jgi:fatty-acyl-CoA synthase